MKRALLALLLVTTVSVFAGAAPADARKREGFDVTPTNSTDKDYDALVGANPQTTVDVNRPSDCNNVTYCDVIPFTVAPPEGLGEDDSFYVTITVSWPDPNKTNDVDMIVYDNGQLQGGAVTRMGKSTTSNNPEKVDLQQPTLGEYQLVVTNVSGVNQGYKVKAKLFRAKFESPVEQLAPPPKQQQAAGGTTTTETRPPESLEPEGSERPASTLAPAPVVHDPSLDFGPTDFPQQIASGGADDFGPAPALRTPAPAKSPSGIVLVLWFVVVPVVLCAAVVAFVYRRRRGLLFAT